MPLPPRFFPIRTPRAPRRLAAAVALTLAAAPAPAAEPFEAVRSQRVELHYRLAGAADAEVELWYTRDRGASWKKYGVDPDGQSPLLFIAPAEGLYGLTLVVRLPQGPPPAPPAPFDPPQRWLFVDYTPPLAQWLGVEPGDRAAGRPAVQLRWTSHDDNLENRPVSLAWQSSVDQQYKPIASDLPNTGRYDWPLPPGATGQVTLKLSVRDRGGHVVERLFGPVPVAAWLDGPSTRPADPAEKASSRPAPPAASRPAPAPDPESRRNPRQRCQQGHWHLQRGQYDLAAERFREALDIDPDLLAARADLAGVYYLQKDYNQAITLYLDVLKRDSRHRPAMRGAALAYVARRQYPQSRDMLNRLLAVDGSDAAARLDLGDVLFMMGDRTGARDHWNRVAGSASPDLADKARRRMELYGLAVSGPPPAVAVGPQ